MKKANFKNIKLSKNVRKYKDRWSNIARTSFTLPEGKWELTKTLSIKGTVINITNLNGKENEKKKREFIRLNKKLSIKGKITFVDEDLAKQMASDYIDNIKEKAVKSIPI